MNRYYNLIKMNPTDTPRTDAASFSSRDPLELMKTSRQLERELNASEAEIERLTEWENIFGSTRTMTPEESQSLDEFFWKELKENSVTREVTPVYHNHSNLK